MDDARRRAWLLRAGVACFALGLVAITVPLVAHARESGMRRVVLAGGSESVTLPAHVTYGIYFDDTDNSGYSESCAITDGRGRPVSLREPGWNVSGSDFENLDYVFNTGAGRLTVDCQSSAERVTLRPAPSPRGVLLGAVLALLLLGAGVAALVMRGRSGRARAGGAWPASGNPVAAPPGWYQDNTSPAQLRYWNGSAWTEHIHPR